VLYGLAHRLIYGGLGIVVGNLIGSAAGFGFVLGLADPGAAIAGGGDGAAALEGIIVLAGNCGTVAGAVAGWWLGGRA
jgi:hypothetical protein